MSAVGPALENLPAGSGKSAAQALRLLPMIGALLLVAGGTLYFWLSSGRHLATDIGVIRRIGSRAAALAGRSGHKADTSSQSGCAAFASCVSNKEATS